MDWERIDDDDFISVNEHGYGLNCFVWSIAFREWPSIGLEGEV
jgi:hypothetical protein